jgi:hypothetical protein
MVEAPKYVSWAALSFRSLSTANLQQFGLNTPHGRSLQPCPNDPNALFLRWFLV